MKKLLTQDRLKEILYYDESSGEFTWLLESFEQNLIGASGFRGVTLKPRLPKPFIAQISGGYKKKIHLGCFSTGEEAHAVYMEAAKRLIPSIKGTVAGSINSTGRWRIKIDYQEHLAHRLAWLYMNGEYPIDIDHKDGNPLNNRLENLRIATPSQNGANRKIGINNTTGFKGVCYVDRKNLRKQYVSSITVNGECKNLGYYLTPEEAHAVYCIAAKRYFGEYARGG